MLGLFSGASGGASRARWWEAENALVQRAMGKRACSEESKGTCGPKCVPVHASSSSLAAPMAPADLRCSIAARSSRSRAVGMRLSDADLRFPAWHKPGPMKSGGRLAARHMRHAPPGMLPLAHHAAAAAGGCEAVAPATARPVTDRHVHAYQRPRGASRAQPAGAGRSPCQRPARLPQRAATLPETLYISGAGKPRRQRFVARPCRRRRRSLH